jgi:hypothetical protein
MDLATAISNCGAGKFPVMRVWSGGMAPELCVNPFPARGTLSSRSRTSGHLHMAKHENRSDLVLEPLNAFPRLVRTLATSSWADITPFSTHGVATKSRITRVLSEGVRSHC